MSVPNASPSLTHSRRPCSATVPDAAQIIEPQKPGGTRARPNAQKTCATWNVFKKEFIKRQQQPDIQRSLVSLCIAAPAKTHRYPTTSKSEQRSLRDFS